MNSLKSPSKKYLFENILITGIGGDIGFGVAKILKECHVAKKIIGSDIHNNHPGKKVVDDTIIIERADSEYYLHCLKDAIEKYSIDLLIPMSEAEIRVFHYNNLKKELKDLSVVLANTKALEIGLDKYITYKFLKSLDLPFPWTILVKKSPPRETPCIIKSRTGSGSKSINIVYDEFIDYYTRNRPDDIWQELLLPEDQEYTCGLYGLKNGDIRTIVFKRRLGGGFSVYGEVTINQEIEDLLLKIAKNLELKGSINIQLRLTERGPIIFEINPRFSSTIVFRHKMGFRDVIWSLYDQKDIPLEEYITPKEGTKFYRGSIEYIE